MSKIIQIGDNGPVFNLAMLEYARPVEKDQIAVKLTSRSLEITCRGTTNDLMNAIAPPRPEPNANERCHT